MSLCIDLYNLRDSFSQDQMINEIKYKDTTIVVEPCLCTFFLSVILNMNIFCSFGNHADDATEVNGLSIVL